jgi:predicted RNA methylase
MSKKKNSDSLTRHMFSDRQADIFESSYEEELEKRQSQPIEGLGMTFQNEEERRKYFLEKLEQKLKDPEFRKIKGFPISSDEEILALSDPPWYTACPNPFIADFIKYYGKPFNQNNTYTREPFAADVSEGKNDPVYNAHSYHTKVPHKAIMRYILHYTDPGDVVLDGFCGTGMTGVAARLCGNKNAVTSLGYRVTKDGAILDSESNRLSDIGARRAILSDLSPVATFISSNYADFSSLATFADEALKLVSKVEKELGWLYEGVYGGQTLSAVWSDVFLCPNCSHEFVFWEAALKDEAMREAFPCPHCRQIVGKAASNKTGAVKLERPFGTAFDPILKRAVRTPKFVLVEETTKKGSIRKSKKIKDEGRKIFASRFEGRSWPQIPTDEFFPGRQTNKLINGSGISYICHMYTQRALFAYGYLWQQELSSHKHTSLFRFCLSAINNYISRKQGYFGGGGGVSGTLFTPSLHIERSVFDVLRRKLEKLRTLALKEIGPVCVSTQSIVDLRNVPSGTIDYIFTDPPFGESLQYAELNMFVEAWLRVRTVIEEDCVLNYVHKKDLPFYSHMMLGAFNEYARLLKDGRWITIEFHNSQNAVWGAIQQAIESSGLVVADVRVLDKQQRSFNAINRAGAVDQDLVISAYKPNGGLEQRFKLTAGAEDGVWDFVRTHLKQLPVFVTKDGKAEIIAERQNYLIFDRMVAFHVQRGVTVPLSAAEFYDGLAKRFPERDGMYFLSEQVAEYDRKRMTVLEVLQLQLFVTDESSAIQWLRQQLLRKPQMAGELKPQFMQEIGGWQKTEKLLELDELLGQNFLRYDGSGEVPSQIHGYLSTNFKELRKLPKDDEKLRAKGQDRWYVPDPNKASDLEKLRERSLLREFDDYQTSSQKRLKVFRLEAVRAGFRKAWQERDYTTIIAVARKIPDNVLQEDPRLLMWYDQAITRKGEDA